LASKTVNKLNSPKISDIQSGLVADPGPVSKKQPINCPEGVCRPISDSPGPARISTRQMIWIFDIRELLSFKI